MAKSVHAALTRREREIMDILYKRGRATAGEVMQALSAETSYSTVRTQLRVLEEKGHVHHEEHGLRYVYVPAVPRHAARKPALKHMIDTFFDGSAEKVVAALLGGEGARLSDEQLDRIATLIEKARKDAPRPEGKDAPRPEGTPRAEGPSRPDGASRADGIARPDGTSRPAGAREGRSSRKEGS